MFNTLQENLQGETRKLVDALKRPQVRGRWGEITLRRVVETAGMNEYCDFTEQVSVDTDEGRLRPDLIVKLPGGKTVVVDAKVPLKAYMEAIESQDDKVREEAVVKHARQVRDHMKLLGTKQYWNQFDPSPDFVVLFLPGESFFSAALETDRDLIVDGIANKVILATPTTLIALLRTVAYSWQQHRMADNAEKIAKAGSELYERICKFLEHLANVRDSLQRATHSFNDAVGSFESRLLPGARRLKDLGAAPADKELPDVGSIDAAPRQLNPQ
jgi:DNA recombination protein RmuC